MTDFDKLIKEKAEQADYTYKPSAWKNFQHQTGMGNSSLKYWVVGVSSAVIIGGLTTVLLLRNDHPTLGNDPSLNVVAIDTISLNVDEDVVLKEDTMVLAGCSEQKAPRNKTVQVAVPESNKEETNDDVTHSARSTKSQKSATPRYGRPLVIDVDTIKENVPTDEELKKGNSRLY